MPHTPLAPLPIRRRWRAGVLVLVIVSGLCVAALEKYRQADVYRVWATVHAGLAPLLEPVMRATRQGVLMARQLGRLQSLTQENQKLRNDLTEARLLAQFTDEELRRVQRLSGLGQWSGPPELSFMMADVTGLVTNEESAEMIINRGRGDGLALRDPVVALGGLVGLVQTLDDHSARVQALTDPLSAVGAVATKSRARGVVYGRGRGKPMEFIPENEIQPIEIGSVLVTSGFENSVFPKGIVVGRIESREANMYGMPYGAVQPVVPFESIEEVMVVLPRRRERGQLLTTSSLGRYTVQIPQLTEIVGTSAPLLLTTTATLNATTASLTSNSLAGATQTSGTRVTTSTLNAPPTSTPTPTPLPALVLPVIAPRPKDLQTSNALRRATPKPERPAVIEDDEPRPEREADTPQDGEELR